MRNHLFPIATTLAIVLGLATPAHSQESVEPQKGLVPPGTGKQFTEPPQIPSLPEELTRIDPPALSRETSYGLEELLVLASNNNPTLRQAQLQISGELGKALEAGLYPNPILSYQGEQIFLNVNGNKNSPGEFQGGVLQQRFVTAGKLQLSRQKYLRRAEVAEHRAMVQQFRVCNDVRVHFYRALAAGETLAIKRELLKTAEDSAVTAQESYNMGQARRPEVRRANISLQRMRLDLMKAENAYREEFRRLAALIGAPLREGMLRGDLLPQCDPLSYDQARQRLLNESPELAAARAKLRADNTTVQRESVEWVPDVVVQGGPGYDYETKETVAVAGIRLEIPIYDRNQGTIRQARADYARQRQEVRRIELLLQERLANIYQQYVTALQHAAEFERFILPESKAAYAELLQSYKENRVAWTDVLTAQHDYFDARLMQVDNLLAARQHEVLIYGYLLHDGLMAAEGVTPPGHINAVPKPR